jgi:hypothetical protein
VGFGDWVLLPEIRKSNGSLVATCVVPISILPFDFVEKGDQRLIEWSSDRGGMDPSVRELPPGEYEIVLGFRNTRPPTEGPLPKASWIGRTNSNPIRFTIVNR